jgi:hypothetical protein
MLRSTASLFLLMTMTTGLLSPVAADCATPYGTPCESAAHGMPTEMPAPAGHDHTPPPADASRCPSAPAGAQTCTMSGICAPAVAVAVAPVLPDCSATHDAVAVSAGSSPLSVVLSLPDPPPRG